LCSVPAYPGARDPALASVDDMRQNLWRFAGRFDRALRATVDWARANPGDPLALDRRGEIEFLRSNYRAAASDFAAAAALASKIRLPRSSDPAERSSDLQRRARLALIVAQAQLKEGAALELDGRFPQARAALAGADRISSRFTTFDDPCGAPDSVSLPALAVSYHARAQAGETALRMRRYLDAEQLYSLARQRERVLLRVFDTHACASPEATGWPLRPDVLENNEALAQMKLGRFAEAIAAAKRAVAFDPANPIFVQTLGFVLETAGDLAEAVRYYGRVLADDPSDYPAANDLGVALARSDQKRAAVVAFRRAIGSRPRFALAWFNLGVVMGELGPGHLLESQGALARASRLDHHFRNEPRRPTLDERIYFSALDLSKPVPPYWSFGRIQQRAALGPSLALILLIIWGAVRAGGDEQLRHLGSERVLEWLRGRRLGVL